MVMRNVTLGRLIDYVNDFNDDIDVNVDGTDFSCALCAGTELTDEGKKHFEKALTLPVRDKWLVECDDDDEYDKYDNGEENVIDLAIELIAGLSGQIPTSKFRKWFREIDYNES